MGLMDKVKARATVLAEKTQETVRDSKAKFDQAQAKRHGDVLLRNLGAAVYAERTGGGERHQPDARVRGPAAGRRADRGRRAASGLDRLPPAEGPRHHHAGLARRSATCGRRPVPRSSAGRAENSGWGPAGWRCSQSAR